MELTPELQNAFDEELAYLKGFNDTYLQDALDFYLQEENSPVKPIIEAITLLSARTQVTARQHISLLHQRLIKQTTSYLISPISAMGLVKLKIDDLIEPTTVPAGTDLVFTSPRGGEAQFKCLFDTPLQAIQLTDIGLVKTENTRCELVLKLEALNDYPGRLDNLKLCLYGHGNYLSAIRLHKLLEGHTSHITAHFDSEAPLDMDADFQLHALSPLRKSLHPLIVERQFFQLPHKDAFVRLHATKSPTQWKRCQIHIHLDQDWPESLLITPELIQLFVTPVENRQPEQTEPIFHEGTRTQHTIRPPANKPELRLCSVRGVYQLKDGEYIALHSALISDKSQTYEIAYPQISKTHLDQAPKILLNMPEAFDEPVKVLLDGYWHNPGFSKMTNDNLSIVPADIDIHGVKWEALTVDGKKFVPFTPPTTLLSEQLLELAALKNKPILSLPELLFIIESLSTVWQGPFRVIKPLIESLEVKHRSSNKRISLQQETQNPTLYYVLQFKEFEPPIKTLAEEFMHHLSIILDHWISHYTIEVIAHYFFDTPNDQKHKQILDQNNHEYTVLEPEISHEH